MDERHVHETRLADELAADFADAVRAVSNAAKCLVDLMDGPVLGIHLAEALETQKRIASVLVLFFTIKENDLEVQLRGEMEQGEKESETVDAVSDDTPMTKANKTMLWLILIAEFFWFMASNGVGTFQTNYFTIALGHEFSMSIIVTAISGVCSIIGFVTAGLIADKIGRKWTLSIGMFLVVLSYAAFCFTGMMKNNPTGATVLLCVIWAINGYGFSLVHTNSFPMVVELCSSKKIGQFTGFYYASSMAAQTVTPVLLGLMIKFFPQGFAVLPYYALGMAVVATVVFLFVKNVHVNKVSTKKGLDALGDDD